jgi:arylsulfatase A-like enzyme
MAGTLPLAATEDIDAVITDDALAWLDGLGEGQPFFLQVAWIAPHPPYVLPPPYDHRYAPEQLRLPPADPLDANKPPLHRRTAEDMGSWQAPEEEQRRALAAYYGMVSLIDDQVARVLEYLERRGLRDHTIVVYTADHGDYAGEHGMWGKSCTLYDALVRVPLVIAGPPGLLPPGRALDGMTQTVDVVPTLLDLLGLPSPDSMHGHSLRPLWEGGRAGPSSGSNRRGFDIAFAEVGAFPPAMVYDRQRGDNVPAGPPASGRQVEVSTMARTTDWKLVYTPGRELQELYDLRTDPGERRNRWGDPALAPIGRVLRDRILDWLQAYT